MSANQRKIAILKTLLERVQQRAAAPRTAAKVAAVALVATTPAEGARPVDDEPTPLMPSSALASKAVEALPVAEEPTPSEDIVVVELSPSPAPVKADEDAKLASEAARIEEALSSEPDDESPASSSKQPQAHPLEAAMAPMELDPISDRPTARITLPPEADPDAVLRELPKASVPVIEEEPEVTEAASSAPAPSAPAPEITISAEPAEELSFEDELIELGEADEAPAAAEAQPPKLPESAEEIPSTPAPASGVTAVEATKPAAAEELDFEDVIVLEESDAAPPVAPVMEKQEAAQPEPVEQAPAPVQEKPRELEAEIVQRPAAAEIEVAAVVGKVETFAPKTFGELLDASLEL